MKGIDYILNVDPENIGIFTGTYHLHIVDLNIDCFYLEVFDIDYNSIDEWSVGYHESINDIFMDNFNDQHLSANWNQMKQNLKIFFLNYTRNDKIDQFLKR